MFINIGWNNIVNTDHIVRIEARGQSKFSRIWLIGDTDGPSLMVADEDMQELQDAIRTVNNKAVNT